MTYNEGLREDGLGRRGYPDIRINVSRSSEDIKKSLAEKIADAKARLKEWGIEIPFSA
ncbi:MAG: hypothetical protein Greene07147_509 [Parcubacteria group bacterium Greene0714_7]|nr:hypothetical protein [Candidatus Paceibacterota bacterium]MBP9832267.1 hypothetical protein [Candidatus Paceibacterota bacterium]TSD05804.1 MAG: hypothetical protein Greene07147_509 [Parcubacteria group bacterium Greene0714_7]